MGRLWGRHLASSGSSVHTGVRQVCPWPGRFCWAGPQLEEPALGKKASLAEKRGRWQREPLGGVAGTSGGHPAGGWSKECLLMLGC